MADMEDEPKNSDALPSEGVDDQLLAGTASAELAAENETPSGVVESNVHTPPDSVAVPENAENSDVPPAAEEEITYGGGEKEVQIAAEDEEAKSPGIEDEPVGKEIAYELEIKTPVEEASTPEMIIESGVQTPVGKGGAALKKKKKLKATVLKSETTKVTPKAPEEEKIDVVIEDVVESELKLQEKDCAELLLPTSDLEVNKILNGKFDSRYDQLSEVNAENHSFYFDETKDQFWQTEEKLWAANLQLDAENKIFKILCVLEVAYRRYSSHLRMFKYEGEALPFSLAKAWIVEKKEAVGDAICPKCKTVGNIKRQFDYHNHIKEEQEKTLDHLKNVTDKMSKTKLRLSIPYAVSMAEMSKIVCNVVRELVEFAYKALDETDQKLFESISICGGGSNKEFETFKSVKDSVLSSHQSAYKLLAEYNALPQKSECCKLQNNFDNLPFCFYNIGQDTKTPIFQRALYVCDGIIIFINKLKTEGRTGEETDYLAQCSQKWLEAIFASLSKSAFLNLQKYILHRLAYVSGVLLPKWISKFLFFPPGVDFLPASYTKILYSSGCLKPESNQIVVSLGPLRWNSQSVNFCIWALKLIVRGISLELGSHTGFPAAPPQKYSLAQNEYCALLDQFKLGDLINYIFHTVFSKGTDYASTWNVVIPIINQIASLLHCGLYCSAVVYKSNKESDADEGSAAVRFAGLLATVINFVSHSFEIYSKKLSGSHLAEAQLFMDELYISSINALMCSEVSATCIDMFSFKHLSDTHIWNALLAIVHPAKQDFILKILYNDSVSNSLHSEWVPWIPRNTRSNARPPPTVRATNDPCIIGSSAFRLKSLAYDVEKWIKFSLTNKIKRPGNAGCNVLTNFALDKGFPIAAAVLYELLKEGEAMKGDGVPIHIQGALKILKLYDFMLPEMMLLVDKLPQMNAEMTNKFLDLWCDVTANPSAMELDIAVRWLCISTAASIRNFALENKVKALFDTLLSGCEYGSRVEKEGVIWSVLNEESLPPPAHSAAVLSEGKAGNATTNGIVGGKLTMETSRLRPLATKRLLLTLLLKHYYHFWGTIYDASQGSFSSVVGKKFKECQVNPLSGWVADKVVLFDLVYVEDRSYELAHDRYDPKYVKWLNTINAQSKSSSHSTQLQQGGYQACSLVQDEITTLKDFVRLNSWLYDVTQLSDDYGLHVTVWIMWASMVMEEFTKPKSKPIYWSHQKSTIECLTRSFKLLAQYKPQKAFQLVYQVLPAASLVAVKQDPDIDLADLFSSFHPIIETNAPLDFDMQSLCPVFWLKSLWTVYSKLADGPLLSFFNGTQLGNFVATIFLQAEPHLTSALSKDLMQVLLKGLLFEVKRTAKSYGSDKSRTVNLSHFSCGVIEGFLKFLVTFEQARDSTKTSILHLTSDLGVWMRYTSFGKDVPKLAPLFQLMVVESILMEFERMLKNEKAPESVANYAKSAWLQKSPLITALTIYKSVMNGPICEIYSYAAYFFRVTFKLFLGVSYSFNGVKEISTSRPVYLLSVLMSGLSSSEHKKFTTAMAMLNDLLLYWGTNSNYVNGWDQFTKEQQNQFLVLQKGVDILSNAMVSGGKSGYLDSGVLHGLIVGKVVGLTDEHVNAMVLGASEALVAGPPNKNSSIWFNLMPKVSMKELSLSTLLSIFPHNAIMPKSSASTSLLTSSITPYINQTQPPAKFILHSNTNIKTDRPKLSLKPITDFAAHDIPKIALFNTEQTIEVPANSKPSQTLFSELLRSFVPVVGKQLDNLISLRTKFTEICNLNLSAYLSGTSIISASWPCKKCNIEVPVSIEITGTKEDKEVLARIENESAEVSHEVGSSDLRVFELQCYNAILRVLPSLLILNEVACSTLLREVLKAELYKDLTFWRIAFICSKNERGRTVDDNLVEYGGLEGVLFLQSTPYLAMMRWIAKYLAQMLFNSEPNGPEALLKIITSTVIPAGYFQFITEAFSPNSDIDKFLKWFCLCSRKYSKNAFVTLNLLQRFEIDKWIIQIYEKYPQDPDKINILLKDLAILLMDEIVIGCESQTIDEDIFDLNNLVCSQLVTLLNTCKNKEPVVKVIVYKLVCGRVNFLHPLFSAELATQIASALDQVDASKIGISPEVLQFAMSQFPLWLKEHLQFKKLLLPHQWMLCLRLSKFVKEASHAEEVSARLSFATSALGVFFSTGCLALNETLELFTQRTAQLVVLMTEMMSSFDGEEQMVLMSNALRAMLPDVDGFGPSSTAFSFAAGEQFSVGGNFGRTAEKIETVSSFDVLFYRAVQAEMMLTAFAVKMEELYGVGLRMFTPSGPVLVLIRNITSYVFVMNWVLWKSGNDDFKPSSVTCLVPGEVLKFMKGWKKDGGDSGGKVLLDEVLKFHVLSAVLEDLLCDERWSEVLANNVAGADIYVESFVLFLLSQHSRVVSNRVKATLLRLLEFPTAEVEAVSSSEEVTPDKSALLALVESQAVSLLSRDAFANTKSLFVSANCYQELLNNIAFAMMPNLYRKGNSDKAADGAKKSLLSSDSAFALAMNQLLAVAHYNKKVITENKKTAPVYKGALTLEYAIRALSGEVEPSGTTEYIVQYTKEEGTHTSANVVKPLIVCIHQVNLTYLHCILTYLSTRGAMDSSDVNIVAGSSIAEWMTTGFPITSSSDSTSDEATSPFEKVTHRVNLLSEMWIGPLKRSVVLGGDGKEKGGSGGGSGDTTRASSSADSAQVTQMLLSFSFVLSDSSFAEMPVVANLRIIFLLFSLAEMAYVKKVNEGDKKSYQKHFGYVMAAFLSALQPYVHLLTAASKSDDKLSRARGASKDVVGGGGLAGLAIRYSLQKLSTAGLLTAVDLIHAFLGEDDKSSVLSKLEKKINFPDISDSALTGLFHAPIIKLGSSSVKSGDEVAKHAAFGFFRLCALMSTSSDSITLLLAERLATRLAVEFLKLTVPSKNSILSAFCSFLTASSPSKHTNEVLSSDTVVPLLSITGMHVGGHKRLFGNSVKVANKLPEEYVTGSLDTFMRSLKAEPFSLDKKDVLASLFTPSQQTDQAFATILLLQSIEVSLLSVLLPAFMYSDFMNIGVGPEGRGGICGPSSKTRNERNASTLRNLLERLMARGTSVDTVNFVVMALAAQVATYETQMRGTNKLWGKFPKFELKTIAYLGDLKNIFHIVPHSPKAGYEEHQRRLYFLIKSVEPLMKTYFKQLSPVIGKKDSAYIDKVKLLLLKHLSAVAKVCGCDSNDYIREYLADISNK